jgi:tetratricopeptide (TPR) repeat protein
MGLLGLMSFLSILAVFFYLCFRYLRRLTADIYKLLLIAMVAGMVQYMADIFFNPTTISPELVFWLSLGLVPVIGRSATSGELEKATALDSIETDNSQKSYVNKTRRYVSAVAALVLIVIGLGITIKPFLADMYLQKGFNFQARQGEQAVLAFDRAVTLAPGEAVYWNSLGFYYYYGAGQVKEGTLKRDILTVATNALEKARELEPYTAFRYWSLADVYTYWAQAGATDKWQTALSLYEKASQLIPDNAIILNKWSLALIIKGDLDEARTKLDYAASIDPDWAETSFLSGLLLAREGKNDEAALQIIAPIQNKSANLNYFIDLCINLATYDMVRPLQNALDAYLPSAPKEWTGHAILGVTSLFTGDLRKSIDELNSAMLAAPGENVGNLFQAIMRLSTMSPPLRAALPNVAEEWRDKLSQSPERDTLLPELDQLISNPK